LREKALMKMQVPPMHQDATFSELAAKRQKLIETERSVACMMDRMEDASYGLPQGLPSSSRQLDTLRLQQEEAMQRLQRLQNQELIMSLPPGYPPRSMHQEPSLSELAAQRQKLLAEERSVSRRMDRMEGTSYGKY
jgi:hypothetical protein